MDLVGKIVRYYVSRPGGREAKTGTVLKVYDKTALITDSDDIRSVRKADIIGYAWEEKD